MPISWLPATRTPIRKEGSLINSTTEEVEVVDFTTPTRPLAAMTVISRFIPALVPASSTMVSPNVPVPPLLMTRAETTLKRAFPARLRTPLSCSSSPSTFSLRINWLFNSSFSVFSASILDLVRPRFVISSKRLLMGERTLLPTRWTGAKKLWVPLRIDETKLTPRKSSVIRNREVTKSETHKSLVLLVPRFAIHYLSARLGDQNLL